MRENPEVVVFRSDLGETYVNLSVLERRVGQPDAAVVLCQEACEKLRDVFHSWPGNDSARARLATACNELAGGLAELGRNEEALQAFRESVNLELELGSMRGPKFPPHHDTIKNGLLGMARCMAKLGRVSDAAEAAEKLSPVCGGHPEDLVAIARELALCSANASEQTAARVYGNRAIHYLTRAVRAGYRNLASMKTDPEFESLHSRSDFADLLADAGFPADPFVR